ncbi:MAG: LysR family transcriptional regulator [Clostridiales bacterium]|nr:LysR family transcriptional regulator [Clostridiales bacterium]
MNSRQLQYVVMLSEMRNFSQVAEALDISQPALSKQIIGLENELGVKLFDRSSTPLTLTAAGEYFAEKARALLFEEDVLLKTMDRYKTGEMGKLTIGISPFRSLYLMPPIIRQLKEKYPDLQIVLREYGRVQLHKALSEGRYDFIITNLPVDESTLEAVPLEQDTLVLAVPDNLLHLLDKPEGSNRPVDFAACEKLPFVVVSQGQEMRQLFDNLCRIACIHPNIYVEVVGITTAWAMVQAGMAATLLPRQFIQAEMTGESITLFEIDQDTYVRQPAVVTRRGQYISEYARYAMDLLCSGKSNS